MASKLLDWGIAFDVVESLIGGLDLVVVPFDQSTALQAANLRAKTKTLGLSLGDRACLALAGISKGIAMTADRAWLQLDRSLELRVECIRS